MASSGLKRKTESRISRSVNERRGVTADAALRLARHFGTRADFWMNTQTSCEWLLARRAALKTIGGQVRRRKIAA
jgi:addiction module HigA family antidote